MASDKATKSMWLRFFRDAGIPQGFDTKYALVFDENRIKHDMLMDVSKECLKDMGITAMGDIIAILKHAKIVYEESKAQAYDIPQPTSTVRLSAPTPAPKSSSPASSGSSCGSMESREPRSVIINSQHKVFATQPSKVSSTAAAVARSKTQNDAPINRTISRQIPSSSSSSMLVSTSSDRKTEPGVKATLMNTSKIVKPTASTIVRLKRSVSPAQREEVPLQKKTRVLKEQEGSYIVKMPEGTTPKTQKLMQDRLGPINNTHVQTTEKKLSVFSRLGGESRVSSSSDVEQVKTKSSVFSRLGQGSTSTASSSQQQQQQVIARPSIDPSDFMKTRFEVRQAISSPALDIAKAHLASNYKTTNSSGLGRLVSDRGSVCSLEPRNDNRISSTGSRMRSSLESADGGSVRSRLGYREINSTTAISRSRSRSISPPPKRQLNDPRFQIRRGVVARRPSPATQFSTTIKPRPPVQVITKPQAQTAIRKMDQDSELSVSRQVVREERFKNAEGKNMIRKTVIKTVRKRI